MTGSLPRARVSSISASVLVSGRSRLLNWITIGTWAALSPFSRMLSWRFAQYWLFSCAGAPPAVGDEGDRVGVLEHDAPGGVVDDLAGNGEQLHLHRVAALGMEEDRQQIEEQGAVVVGLDRQQLSAPLALGAGVDHLQIGRLPGQTGPVVDDLDRQFSLSVVELHEGAPRDRTQVAVPGESALENTGGRLTSRMAAPVRPPTTEGPSFRIRARMRTLRLGSTEGTRGWRR